MRPPDEHDDDLEPEVIEDAEIETTEYLQEDQDQEISGNERSSTVEHQQEEDDASDTI